MIRSSRLRLRVLVTTVVLAAAGLIVGVGGPTATPKQQAAVIVDRVARIKETYEKVGPGRSNLAYGYVAKRPA